MQQLLRQDQNALLKKHHHNYRLKEVLVFSQHLMLNIASPDGVGQAVYHQQVGTDLIPGVSVVDTAI